MAASSAVSRPSRNFAAGPWSDPSAWTDEVDEALRAVALGEIGQLVELLARVVADARRHDAEDGPAGRDRLGEDAEVDLADRIGQVGELHAEADVGLVGSVSVHGLREGQPREGLVQQRPIGKHLLRDAGDDALDGRDDVLLGHEAHLDVDLGVLRLAVAAQVLVAVGVGELVVAVVAGDHQQLLELLRRLRQRVELAGAQPRRHDEVARALRRRADQRRRLDLDEALVLERARGCCWPGASA